MRKFKDYLKEKWAETVKGRSVWENPTSSDIKDMQQEPDEWFRFTADPKKKKVWVWTANKIHYDMFRGLNLPWDKRGKYLIGTAEIKNGRLQMYNSDEIDSWIVFKMKGEQDDPHEQYYRGVDWSWIAKANWSWLQGYVDCKSWLSSAIKDMKNIKKR